MQPYQPPPQQQQPYSQQPQQPYPPPQPLGFAPPPTPKKKVQPRSLVVILALKGISALLALAFGIMAYAALSNVQTETPHFGTQVQDSHALGNLALVMVFVSAVELAGVLGAYTFKRWGVFIVVGFTVFSALLHMKNGETASAAFSLLSTAALSILIFPRWAEFE